MAESGVRVCVRVRPLNAREYQSGQAEVWLAKKDTITQVKSGSFVLATGGAKAGAKKDDSGAPKSYSFDRVFSSGEDTGVLYEEMVQEVVAKVVSGFNGTIFAYGQTSSGKTHTIRGYGDAPGIITYAVQDIFEAIEQSASREFLIRVSFIEIYNECVNDLLNMDNTNLKVIEDKEKGTVVAGLTEDCVVNIEQTLELLQKGDRSRHVGATNMNATSSRSHSIFKLSIESRGEDGGYRVSSLNLVDLAGSERSKSTGAEGQRLKEGNAINKSLLVLGTVISQLSSRKKGHVPYRDSKLTRILQSALGGNSLTTIICTITPSNLHSEETHSTLRFASRAKQVVNNAKVNEGFDDKSLLAKYEQEIEELKKQLESQAREAPSTPTTPSAEDLEMHAKKDEQIRKLVEEKKKLSTFILKSSIPLNPGMRERSCSELNPDELLDHLRQHRRESVAAEEAAAGVAAAGGAAAGLRRHSSFIGKNAVKFRRGSSMNSGLPTIPDESSMAEMSAALEIKQAEIDRLKAVMEEEVKRRVSEQAKAHQEQEEELKAMVEDMRTVIEMKDRNLEGMTQCLNEVLAEKVRSEEEIAREREAIMAKHGDQLKSGPDAAAAAARAQKDRDDMIRAHTQINRLAQERDALTMRCKALEENMETVEEEKATLRQFDSARRQTLNQFRAGVELVMKLRYLDLDKMPEIFDSTRKQIEHALDQMQAATTGEQPTAADSDSDGSEGDES